MSETMCLFLLLVHELFVFVSLSKLKEKMNFLVVVIIAILTENMIQLEHIAHLSSIFF